LLALQRLHLRNMVAAGMAVVVAEAVSMVAVVAEAVSMVAVEGEASMVAAGATPISAVAGVLVDRRHGHFRGRELTGIAGMVRDRMA
jgi:hypothetical protein